MAATSAKPDSEEQVPFPRAPNALEIFCRLRPRTAKEDNGKDNPLIQRQSDAVLVLRRPNSPTEQLFTFEHIFEEDCEQRLLFERVAAPKIAALLSGEGDGLIFAYGTTGSGKSFTIGGQPGKPGLVPSTIASLFSQLAGRLSTAGIIADGTNYYTIDSAGAGSMAKDADQEAEDDCGKGVIEKWLASAANTAVKESNAVNRFGGRRYAVFISFVEIYNNYIYDLLQKTGAGGHTATPDTTGADGRRRPPLQLRLDVGRSTLATHKSTNFSVYAHGAREVQARTAKQAMRLFLQGQQNRQTAATKLNLTSSRSHSVFTIKLVSYEETALKSPLHQQQQQQFTVRQLSVVDLAGVERSKWSGVSGSTLAETSNINNSLLTLRNCFQVMRKNQQQASSTTSATAAPAVVPYRNHKLTYLLKSFFEGGKSSISMIICLNAMADVEENAQVLAFCSKAQEVLIIRQQQPQQQQLQQEGGNFEVDEQMMAANDDHLSSTVDRFTLTRPELGKEHPEMTTSAEFAAFIRQIEHYLDAHVNDATLLMNTWHQSLQQLSERLRHYPPERQAHRQSLCLNEGSFYSLKTSARIVSQLMPPKVGLNGCRRVSCQLYRLKKLFPQMNCNNTLGTPITITFPQGRTRSTVGGGTDVVDGKLKDSQRLYQNNARLLSELTRELIGWQAASVDAVMKQHGARADLALYIMNRGDGSGKGRSSGGGSVKKKLDVFNRLYLQTPARYKTAAAVRRTKAAEATENSGKVSHLRAFFTPPLSTQQLKKSTTTAAVDHHATPRKVHLPAGSSKAVVQTMCKRFNDM